jgi:superfamily II DNA or RNA helicase
VTGGGKTVLALHGARLLGESLARRGEALKVHVVVPKTFLVSQWRAAILAELGIRRREIGSYQGAHKDDPSLPYMIYVLNSARFSLSRHILADIQNGFHVLLIVDECHHCAGEINGKIFDFVPKLGENFSRYHVMALSATAESIAEDPRFTAALGSVIYRYGLAQALREGVVSEFLLFHVGVSFLPEEREEYEYLSVRLAKGISVLKRLLPSLRGLGGAALFARLQGLVSVDGAVGRAASLVLRLSLMRKEISHLAENRIACACDLVRLLPTDSKILLFGERIQSAARLYTRLCELLPGQVAMYHSGMDRESAKNALLRYESGEIRVLVGCRALDEGLNIPETDVGIVVSSSRAERQRIQRLGRILRRKASPLPAKLYYLYLGESNENEAYMDDEADASAPILPLSYDSEAGFWWGEYRSLIIRVLAQMDRKGITQSQRTELLKNLNLCLPRGDFYLSEDLCRQMRDAAENQPERNYWTAALLLARARVGEGGAS